MQLDYRQGLDLAKRAAGWAKGMSLPGTAEQQSYALLERLDNELVLSVRGPHGWLTDTIPTESEEEFRVGAVPSKLLEEMQQIYGRSEVELVLESKGGRDRVVFSAEGYRRPCLTDHLSGFAVDVDVPLPDVELGASSGHVEIEAGLLKELLQMALQAAPTSEVSQARAVVSLVFEEETAIALATDGFLLMCARTELEAAVEGRLEVNLQTEAAARLFGLLSTVSDGELTLLDVEGEEEERFLCVGFEAATPELMMPLPALEAMPVERILEGTAHRESIAVVTVSPQTVADLTVMGWEKSVVLEADGERLSAWSRSDIDAAEEDAYTCVTIAASEVRKGEVAVDSKVLGSLCKLLKGDTLDLQVAKGSEGPGLLVVEQTSESDVSVLAAIVAQHQEG